MTEQEVFKFLLMQMSFITTPVTAEPRKKVFHALASHYIGWSKEALNHEIAYYKESISLRPSYPLDLRYYFVQGMKLGKEFSNMKEAQNQTVFYIQNHPMDSKQLKVFRTGVISGNEAYQAIMQAKREEHTKK